MFVLPGYKFRYDVYINAENHGMFSCREHWNGEHVVLWTGLCMGVLLNGHLHWDFLALKNTSSLSEPSQPSYLAGISLKLHLVAAWWRPRSKHVCSKCALHKNECSVGPDHFALVSFTLIVQIRLYLGSDGSRWGGMGVSKRTP